jgi:transcriptional regulator with XRE-family HTH domain
MEFKAACKKAGQNINETLEEAVRDWINKQEQSKSQRQGNLYQGNFSRSISTDNISQDIDLIFSTLPTISTAIQDTLQNQEWGLKHLAKDSKISVSRLKKLLSGDRPSDEEIENLASCLVRVNGKTFDEEELNDMRLAEDLKQRHIRRERKRKLSEGDRTKQ